MSSNLVERKQPGGAQQRPAMPRVLAREEERAASMSEGDGRGRGSEREAGPLDELAKMVRKA